MNINVYTLALTYYMACLGVASLSLVETIETPFVGAVAAVCAVSLYFNLKKRVIIRHFLWNVIAIFIFIFFIIDYMYISESLIVSSSRFLAVLMAFKLFDVKTNRDYLLAFALIFFQLLAAAASTVNITFFIILSLFVLGGIWAMILFNLKRDWQNANPGAEVMPIRVFGGTFFAFIFFSAVSSILISLVVFFIMPRVELGFFQRKTANTLKTSGFSEDVNLGEIGSVKLDQTVVMRVEIKTAGAPKKMLRFRGSALDSYDGKKWHNSFKGKKARLLQRDSLGRFKIRDRTPGTIEQTILLEPLDTEILFAASDPVSIEGRFQSLSVDAAGVIYLPSVPHSRIEYTAASSQAGFYEMPEPDRGPYVDISLLKADPGWANIAALSKRVTAGLKSNKDKARAIENYLRMNYSYTLNPAITAGKSPLEDFLFYSKEGYCEHFATAMIVLLRASNVPARLVTGFLHGNWNAYGNYMIVRQSNAHSWVEVYLEQESGDAAHGWLTLDPTPSASLDENPNPSAFALYMDLIRWKWNKNIVQFNFSQQRELARSVEGGTFMFLREFRNLFKSSPDKRRTLATRSAVFIAALILLAGLLATAYFFKKSKAALKTPAYYIELLNILESKGYVRRSDETPYEFAKRVNNPVVTAVTERFQEERYGIAVKSSETDSKEIALKLKALKSEIQPYKAPGETRQSRGS